MSKKNASRKKPRVPSGAIGFMIAFLVLSAIGAVLKDSQEPAQLYDPLIGKISVMSIMCGSAFASFFVMWMLYYAYFILPGSNNAEWERGYRLLWHYYIYQARTYIEYLFYRYKTRKQERPRRSQQAAAPKPTYKDRIGELGAGVVPTHIVLALDRIPHQAGRRVPRKASVGFSRAAGPGVVILHGNYIGKTEKIMRTLDMRPQLRREPVEAMTSDGIEIKTDVIVIFHVTRNGQGERNAAKQNNHGKRRQNRESFLLYPYHEDDIKHVRYDSSIDAKLHVSEWSEHIAPLAAVLLADELSARKLEELHDINGVVLEEIRESVHEHLVERLNKAIGLDDDGNELEIEKSSGITIKSVNLQPIEEPEPVQKQRLNLWKMEIAEQIHEQESNQEIQSAQAIQSLRAKAQLNIVNNIIQSIQSMYDAQHIDLSEIITLRMISALEEAMKNESLMVMTPQMLTHWVTDSIKQMHALLEEGEE